MQLLAGGARGERAGRQAHVVVGALEAARGAAVLLVAELVGKVLAQRAAEGDVDQLHAAADAEHRHVALDRAAGERELDAVALGHGVVGLGMGLGAVGGGVDVVAAGEDQPVEQVEHLVRVVLERARRAGSSPPARPRAGSRRCSSTAAARRRARSHTPQLRAGERGADSDHGSRSLIESAQLPPRSASARWIFPLAVLGSSSAKSTIRGYLYGAVCVLDVLLQLARERVAGREAVAQHDDRAHDRAALVVGRGDDRGLGHGRVGDERRLDLERADPVARPR